MMPRIFERTLLLLVGICSLRLASAQGACPSVDGYAFYTLQEVPAAYIIKTVAAGDVAALGSACSSTPRCNAFDTTGALMIVPMVPFFSILDVSSADVAACDGVYVTSRTLNGFILPDGVNADKLPQAGLKKLQDMQVLAVIAAKVAAKLSAKNLNPRSASSLPRATMVQAFTDANVPLAQSSDTAGTYTYASVVAALSYPVWDSRTANGTSYNFISPVKDQGNCGSCVAFAATAAAEAAVGAVKGAVSNTNDFSEQWLFFCNGLYTPACSTGWYGSQAADVIVRKNIPSEANYPYIASPSCTLASSPEVRAGGKFSVATYSDINLAKEHIRTYGAVMSYFAVYNDFFSWSAASKPYAWDGVSALAGYHQVLVVGYNDTGSYWIVKNSWGTWWGDKGFFRISYSANVGFMSGSYDSIIGLGWSPALPPSPPPPSPTPSVCGDGTCAADETCASCPGDCGACATCGDGICSGGETCQTCKADCGIKQADGSLTCCGDGICSSVSGETCGTCARDCGTCPTCNKNGICEPALGEKCVNGTSGCSDCGTCSSAFCGDGKCTSSRKGYSETCASCAKDCGGCTDPLYCGDGKCSSPENTSSCPRDCSKSKLTRVSPGVAIGNGNGNAKGKSGVRRSLVRL